MLGQDIIAPRSMNLAPRFQGRMQRAPVQRPWLGCATCGLGAVGGAINLGDADILLELKTLMTILTPALGSQGEGWFTAPWSSSDWEAYKAILAKLPGSVSEKQKLVAYSGKSGIVLLGMPPTGTTGFPSIYGIAAMGNRLISNGIMTQESSKAAFPALTTAAAAASASGLKAGDAGVTAPSSGGGSSKTLLIVAGVGVALVLGYVLLKKK